MNDVREGLDVAERYKTAVTSGNAEELKKLLKEHMLPSETRFEQGDTLLHLAIRNANPEAVKIIVENQEGVDLAAQNRRANTPLCLAVQLSKPNTQLYSAEQREALKTAFEKISLYLIEKDSKLHETAKIQNIMRKSVWDFLNKTVKNPKIREALNSKTMQLLASEAKIPSVKKAAAETSKKESQVEKLQRQRQGRVVSR
ncbi:MAG: ankyrin repeat domain-containing protein [Rickettsiales bacterium]